MQPLQKNLLQRINPYHLLVFLYVISAIAFESTANTSIISSVAIYLVFAAGVFYVFSRNSLFLNGYTIFLMLFCIYAFLMCFAQGASSSSFQIAYWNLTCSVLCVIVFWFTLREKKIISVIILANILGGLLLVARIISIYGGISNILEIATQQGENRIGNLVNNQNAIGLFLASAVLSCVFFILRQKKHPIFINILLVLTIIILAYMLLLTGSRKSTAFMLGSILVFLFLHARKLNILKKLVLYTLVIIGIIALIQIVKSIPAFSTLVVRFELFFEGFLKGESSYETDQTRIDMIANGLKAFEQKPLFGNGTGHSHALFNTYSHNNFVELLMNYGILGFSLYYIPYATLVVKLISRAWKKDLVAIFLFTFILIQLALGVGWVNYYDRTAQLITAAAWGYLENCKTTNGETIL